MSEIGIEIVEIASRYPIMVVARSSVAQLVERTAVNRIVAGSSPARGAITPPRCRLFPARSVAKLPPV